MWSGGEEHVRVMAFVGLNKLFRIIPQAMVDFSIKVYERFSLGKVEQVRIILCYSFLCTWCLHVAALANAAT